MLYVADQLMTPDPGALLPALEHIGVSTGDVVAVNPDRSALSIVPIDADAVATLDRLRDAFGKDLPPVGAHRVLALDPNLHIGPGTDPHYPVTSAKEGPPLDSEARIIVVDTGQWVELDPVNPNVDIIDVDIVDSDGDSTADWYGAGHGGFIAGLIYHASGASASGLRVVAKSGFSDTVDYPLDPAHGPALTEVAVVAAVDQALTVYPDASIVNLSLGTYRRRGRAGPLLVLEEAMDRWVATTQVLFVCAAGNDGRRSPHFPAAFAVDHPDRVVSVGAMDHWRSPPGPATFSNHGTWVTAWAPGVSVVAPYPDVIAFDSGTGPADVTENGTTAWSGTSFAAPLAAVEILRAAVDNGTDPVSTWAQMKANRPFVVFSPPWLV
jgi:hypothetical protein